MDLLIKNGTVVTGDGTSELEKAHVWVEGGRVVNVVQGDLPSEPDVATVVDAKGCLVIPGVINGHTHGCTEGPSMPSGSPRLPREETLYLLNRFLLEGTTTVLNVCGLAFAEEVAALNRDHPVNLHVATAHTPSNIAAAQAVDGRGLSEAHATAKAEDVLSSGARALGEAGGGHTLGGGAQDYRFIPDGVERLTGVRIHPLQAKRLKVAVLGRYLTGEGVSDAGIVEAIEHAGLSGRMSVDQAKEVVRGSVLPPLQMALDGFDELASVSERTGYPAIFHNSTPTAKLLIELAEKYPKATLVAGHSNHNMFSAEESVDYARQMRDRGMVIDVSTLDCIHTLWRNGPENLDALVEAGLVDTITTDYAGGHWDSILSAVHRIVVKKQATLPQAVAMATGNVAKALPQLADGRGLLQRGAVADVVISDGVNVSRVRSVVVNGRVVVRDGVLLPHAA